jgi:hypothetical protein
VDYKSSIHEVDFFLGSHIWDDMQADFELWLDSVRNDMELCDSVDEFRRCQGRAEAMRFVLKWAENLREILEEEKTK